MLLSELRNYPIVCQPIREGSYDSDTHILTKPRIPLTKLFKVKHVLERNWLHIFLWSDRRLRLDSVVALFGENS